MVCAWDNGHWRKTANSSPPSRAVSDLRVGSKLVRNITQQGITRCVATGIVDLLEAVQINEQSAKGFLRSPCRGIFEQHFESGAVGQAGQGVVAGGPGQPHALLAYLGYIFDGPDGAFGSITWKNSAPPHVGPEQLARTSYQLHFTIKGAVFHE